MLELIGGFDPNVYTEISPGVRSIGHRSRQWPLVHGETRGHQFTLTDLTVHASNGLGTDVSTQDLNVTRVFDGIWLDEPDEQAFTTVRVELDYLLAWSGLSAMEYTVALNGGVRERWSSAKVQLKDSLEAHWGDLKFTVDLSYSPFIAKAGDPNSQTLASTQTAYLEIESPTPLRPSEWDEHVGTFQNLLTLSCNYPCAIRRFRLGWTPTPGAAMHYPTSIGRYIYPADQGEFRERHSRQFFYLTESNVGFAELVPAWFELWKVIREPAILVFSLFYSEEGYLNAQLLTMCGALEAVHKKLFNRMAELPEDFDAFMADLVTGVDPARHDSVRSRIQNQPSYAARIRELTTKADAEAVTRLLPTINTWVKQVARSRNSMAHASLGPSSLELQYFLLLVSRTLCLLIFAEELGISAERQRAFVASHDVVQWSLNLKQALGD